MTSVTQSRPKPQTLQRNQFHLQDRMICTLLSLFSLFSRAMAEARERTFIMVKPDGVQRGLVGKIIKRFEAKGFKLVAMKFMWVSTILAYDS